MAAGSHQTCHAPARSSLPSPLGGTDAVAPADSSHSSRIKVRLSNSVNGACIVRQCEQWEGEKTPPRHYSTAHTVWTSPPTSPVQRPLAHNDKKTFEAEIKSGSVLIQLYSRGTWPDGLMRCDWTCTHVDMHIAWPSSITESGEGCLFQHRCWLGEHFFLLFSPTYLLKQHGGIVLLKQRTHTITAAHRSVQFHAALLRCAAFTLWLYGH